MKEKAPLWLLGSILFLGLVGGLVRMPNAYAGDDPVTALSMSVDAGAAEVCSSRLTLNHYAVQPTVAAYVAATPVNDGGVGLLDTTKHVKVGADKLYDVWTTSDRPYICCKPAVAGAASTCKILKYREF